MLYIITRLQAKVNVLNVPKLVLSLPWNILKTLLYAIFVLKYLLNDDFIIGCATKSIKHNY